MRTLDANTAKQIKLKVIDGDGRAGVWVFNLPSPSADFAQVLSTSAGAMAHPEWIENQKDPTNLTPPDLSRIVQYQLLGDWSKGRLDAELKSISFVPADATITVTRDAFAKQQADAQAKKTKQQAEDAAAATADQEKRIAAYSARTDRSPEITRVSLVAPNILCLTIDAQDVVPVKFSKYESQPGDEKKVQTWADGTVQQGVLIRNGKRAGRLLGKDLDWFATEKIVGDPLLEFMAGDPSLYTIQSADDLAFANGVKPVAVDRKSAPSNVVLPSGQWPVRHQIFLTLPSNIQDGKTYSVTVDKLNVKRGEVSFHADLKTIHSDAIHVNQIGYRPDNLVKCAFLSIWLGTGGPHDFGS